MYTRYAEFLSSEEATVKTAREFWKELDRKEMEKGSLVSMVGVILLVVGVVDVQLAFLVLCS